MLANYFNVSKSLSLNSIFEWKSIICIGTISAKTSFWNLLNYKKSVQKKRIDPQSCPNNLLFLFLFMFDRNQQPSSDIIIYYYYEQKVHFAHWIIPIAYFGPSMHMKKLCWKRRIISYSYSVKHKIILLFFYSLFTMLLRWKLKNREQKRWSDEKYWAYHQYHPRISTKLRFHEWRWYDTLGHSMFSNRHTE